MRRTVFEWMLAALISAALVWAVVVALTGGFTLSLGPIHLRSHDALRPFAVGIALILTLAARFRDRLVRYHGVVAVLRRFALWFALAAAIVLAAAAIRYGTFVASGADAYGYVSQAYWWLDGRLAQPQPIADELPWRQAERAFAPLGYRPSPDGQAIVPVYSPGLPMMMAVAAAVAGACGPFLVVPFFCGVLVYATYVLGRRAGGPFIGLGSTLLVAVSPTVLFQAMWPMSDVPAAALWTAVLAVVLRPRARDAAIAGGIAALALLVRPNLVLVPAAIAGALVLTSSWRRALAFAFGVAPAALIVAALNTIWYGAPWMSGYGRLESLYGLEHLQANLAGYLGALWHSQTLLIFLCLLPLAGLARGRVSAEVRGVLGALVAAMWLSYLFYLHFPEWWYLRFLLPAIPAMIVLALVAVDALVRRAPPFWRGLVAATIVFVVFSAELSFARDQRVLTEMRALEHRYIDIAQYVDAALPRNAAIISMQHSGSLRFYAGRLTVRWDWLNKSTLPHAARDLRRAGFHPYAVLEDWELPAVRDRLGLPKDAPLPWPLIARMKVPKGIGVYDAHPRPRIVVPVPLTGTTDRDCVRPRRDAWR